MIGMIEVGCSSPLSVNHADEDKAIRQTLHFYATHMRESSRNPPQLILLTDDRRNRELAVSEGLQAVNTREYVDGLVPEVRQGLVDLVVGGVDEIEPGERRGRRIYDDVSHGATYRAAALLCDVAPGLMSDQYLPQDTLSAGVKAGRYHQGHFNANQYNYLEVYLKYMRFRHANPRI